MNQDTNPIPPCFPNSQVTGMNLGLLKTPRRALFHLVSLKSVARVTLKPPPSFLRLTADDVRDCSLQTGSDRRSPK